MIFIDIYGTIVNVILLNDIQQVIWFIYCYRQQISLQKIYLYKTLDISVMILYQFKSNDIVAIVKCIAIQQITSFSFIYPPELSHLRYHCKSLFLFDMNDVVVISFIHCYLQQIGVFFSHINISPVIIYNVYNLQILSIL